LSRRPQPSVSTSAPGARKRSSTMASNLLA
jgi:hypothetical protein